MSVAAFLEAAGWGGAARETVAGDASARVYVRLRKDGKTAVLMEAPVGAPVAPPAEGESFAAFLAMAGWLRAHGLSAPEIHAADAGAGLMLIEDFGDGLVARLAAEQGREAGLYRAAAEVLAVLDGAEAEGLHLGSMGPEGMAAMLGLAFDEMPDRGRAEALAEAVGAVALPLFRDACAGAPRVALRDYHAGNLMWLPERDGVRRIGLLDFQDALLAPRGYDLASLIDDPRREVPEALRAELIAHHAAATGDGGLAARVEVLSLQRNLRILGIFRRAARERGRPAYLSFLPRTARLVAQAAERAEAVDLRALVAEVLAGYGLAEAVA